MFSHIPCNSGSRFLSVCCGPVKSTDSLTDFEFMWVKAGHNNTVKWLILLHKHQDIKYFVTLLKLCNNQCVLSSLYQGFSDYLNCKAECLAALPRRLSLIPEILDCKILNIRFSYFHLLSPCASLLVTLCSFHLRFLCLLHSHILWPGLCLSLALILWFSFSHKLPVP